MSSADAAPQAGTAADSHGLGTDAAWQQLLDSATGRYRNAGRFAWHFARGKLSRDPAFRSLVEGGSLAGRRSVVDIGCGQGLLAGLLDSCNALQRSALWPPDWPPAPAVTRYTGIELMQRDVRRAERALAESALQPRFICADMCGAALPDCDAVVMLDVLHYVDHAAQQALLLRVRQALQPGGRLLLRVGDAASRGRFVASQWVDRIVTLTRGHSTRPAWGRTLAEWTALLHSIGFATSALPMSRGTPFANVLLVADLPSTFIEDRWRAGRHADPPEDIGRQLAEQAGARMNGRNCEPIDGRTGERAGRRTGGQMRAQPHAGPADGLPSDGSAIERAPPPPADTRGVNEAGVPERSDGTRPIKAQSAAVARATASICNAGQARSGGTGGHAGFVGTFSA